MKVKICEEKTCKGSYTNGGFKWVDDFKYCPYCAHNLSTKEIF